MGCNGFSQQLSEVWDHLWFRAEKPSSFILWFDMLYSTHITTLSCLDRQSCSRYKKPTYKKRERIHRNGRQRLLIVVLCGFWGHHLNVDKKNKEKIGRVIQTCWHDGNRTRQNSIKEHHPIRFEPSCQLSYNAQNNL